MVVQDVVYDHQQDKYAFREVNGEYPTARLLHLARRRGHVVLANTCHPEAAQFSLAEEVAGGRMLDAFAGLSVTRFVNRGLAATWIMLKRSSTKTLFRGL